MFFCSDCYEYSFRSFPTRRSSDLTGEEPHDFSAARPPCRRLCWPGAADGSHPDRKSTRLNSSHVAISYAVCCLKKKINNGDSTGLDRFDTADYLLAVVR